MRKRIVLNISGDRFETYRKTLRRFPTTVLGSLSPSSIYYSPTTKQYNFYRNRMCFEAILFFYQSGGLLRKPNGVLFSTFFEECKFFKIPDDAITEMERDNGRIPELWKPENRPPKATTYCARIWDLLENPETSIYATIFGFFSMFAIFLSAILIILHTAVGDDTPSGGVIFILETVTNFWFLIEVILRFIFSPSKIKFFTYWLHWVDLISVLPHFITFGVQSTDTLRKLKFLRTIRLLRVVRLLRLSKQSKRLQVVVRAITECVSDMQMLFMCFVMAILLGASTVYYAEEYCHHDGRSPFESIPDSIYWAIVTSTSVGYGDIVPQTPLGRFITALFLIFGIVTVTCPIHSLVTSFIELYSNNVEEGDIET